jgi:hypothetical protein
MSDARKEFRIDQCLGGVASKAVLGFSDTGVRFERDSAKEAKNGRAAQTTEFVPENVSKFGCDHSHENDGSEAEVAKPCHCTPGDHDRGHQQGQTNAFQEREDEQPQITVVHDGLNVWIHRFSEKNALALDYPRWLKVPQVVICVRQKKSGAKAPLLRRMDDG